MSIEVKTIEMPVYIPNLEGDGIAETHIIKVSITVDSETGEESLTEDAIRMIDETKARYMGLLVPDDLLKMRKQLGLTQERMSELLQAGGKSYTRWESGRARPSRMVNVLLRLLYEGKVFVSDLVALKEQGVDWREKIECRPQMQRPYNKIQINESALPWTESNSEKEDEDFAAAA